MKKVKWAVGLLIAVMLLCTACGQGSVKESEIGF